MQCGFLERPLEQTLALAVEHASNPLGHLVVAPHDVGGAIEIQGSGGVGELVIGGGVFSLDVLRYSLGFAEPLDPRVHQEHGVGMAFCRDLVEA